MSQELTTEEIKDLPQREYAERAHKAIGAVDAGGHHTSPEAIGGYYGIQWWEVFENTSGQRYKVRCYDGVDRSSGPFKEERPNYIPDEFIDEGWSNHPFTGKQQ